MKTYDKSAQPQALFGMSLDQLEQLMDQMGHARFRAAQLFDFLYKQGITSMDQAHTLPQELRNTLAQEYTLGRVAPMKVDVSSDGTKKYLFQMGAAGFVEAAYIPDGERHTLCVSTQVGCKMGCMFCMTGKQGFQKQLTPGQILNQLYSIPESEQITNIVYMGMGEPLDNLDGTLESIELLRHPRARAMGSKRITVSTVGLLPALDTLLENQDVHLAISLHSPFDRERNRIMPVQNVHPLAKVIESLKKYQWGGKRRLSFEYIVFAGVNHSEKHASELTKLMEGLSTRINIIPFHPIPGSPLKRASDSEMDQFRALLVSKGLRTTIRKSRGLDIDAACGMLSTKELVALDHQDF